MKLLSEFKEFINRGNAIDMAVGIIIGGAFTTIVTSFTNDLINPFIKLVTGSSTEIPGLTIPVPGTANGIDFSAFLSSILNFLIVAAVVFLLVKGINKAQDVSKDLAHVITKKIVGSDGVEVEVDMIAPTCPYCLEEVKEGATRCPHCAATFNEPAAATLQEEEQSEESFKARSLQHKK